MPGAARTVTLAFAVIFLAAIGEWFLAAVYGEDEVGCRQASLPASLPSLPEASGVAASRRTPGLLWSMNDSGEPVVTALNDQGEVKGRVRVAGATVADWEDVSVGRCAGGSCLYIADVGDNRERRSTVRFYRVPEPRPGDTMTAAAESVEAKYPDRAHDAEAAFVTPDGTAYVITKERPAGLYRLPHFDPGTTQTLERVAMLPMPKVTDADASPDGEWVVVRNPDEVVFYRTRELLKGDVEHGAAVKVNGFGEPQGEGVTFGTGGIVYLAGEGGGRHAPGTLLSLQCRMPKAGA
jgi:hypothetical protein